MLVALSFPYRCRFYFYTALYKYSFPFVGRFLGFGTGYL